MNMSDKEKLDFLLSNKEKAILMIAKDLIINTNPLDNIQSEYLKINNISKNDFIENYDIYWFRKLVSIDKIWVIKYLTLNNRWKFKIWDKVRILNYVFNLKLIKNKLFLEKTNLLNSDKTIFSKQEIKYVYN